MKKILNIVLGLITCTCSFGQVGINTEEPTRMLDVAGDLILTDVKDKTNTAEYSEILAANAENNIDKVGKPSIIEDATRQVEIVKNIYNATSADINRETDCGDLVFRINGSTIELKLKEAPTKDYTLTYGGKRWGQVSGSEDRGYTYNNITLSLRADNWNTFQNIDSSFTLRQGAYLNYHFIIPGDGDLYRLTVSQLKNDAVNSNYALICERFYKTIN